MKLNKAIILVATLTMTVALFAGCNMLKGAKKDVEDAGDAVARGAQDIREDWDLNTRNRTLGNINNITDVGANRYNGTGNYTDTLPNNSMLARSGSLGIHHLVTLMDMGQEDINTVLGTGRLADSAISNGTSFTHSMFGGHADINIDYDNDGKQIKQMKVYVDNDQLTRWQSELNNRYGIAGSNQGNLWNTENVRIKMTPGTEKTEILITKNV